MEITSLLSLDSLRELLVYDPERPLLFHTGQFLFLFLIFMGVYLVVVDRKPLRIVWVLAFSLFFYYKSSGLYFLLLLVSTAIDFVLGQLIYGSTQLKRRRLYLLMSILSNLGMLAVFKYANFFIDSLNTFMTDPLDAVNIILPVGISFFTFQTMSYTIDIYRKKLDPVDNIVDFGFFVSFFPQLVAGPIVRASQFLPQVRQDILVTREDVGRGFLLICIGLFKKGVISDFIATHFVDSIFEVPALHTGFENLMAVYGYALQIYCDFSGYSDMAIGIGLLLGYRLPINFNAPYQSSSIQEFWRRWHISLSSWLRDYLYISLGGNRRGKFRTYLNLMITMVLGGLWHGAAWRFVVWGFLHGIALALDRMLKDARIWVKTQLSMALDTLDQLMLKGDELESEAKLLNWFRQARWFMQGWFTLVLSVAAHVFGVIFTFHFVCLCWVFFRAESFDLAWDMLENIYLNFKGDVAWQVMTENRSFFLFMLLGYTLHFLPDDLDILVEKYFVRSHMVVKSAIIAIIIFMVILVQSGLDIPQKFIYYQF
ncbi:MAG: MBOAT family O-acyltransferase [Bacteroidota bacterium]